MGLCGASSLIIALIDALLYCACSALRGVAVRSAAAKRTAMDQLEAKLLLELKRADLYKQQAEAVQRQYEVACRLEEQRQKDVHALERRVMELRVESSDKDVRLAEVQVKLAEAAKRSAELERDALALRLQTHVSEAKAPPASASAASAASATASQVACSSHLRAHAHSPLSCTV
jgi:hypothetical protein